jgi:hypothetical protein
MFCAPGLVFGDVECVGSRFHVLCARTHFRWYRGRRSRFHVLRARSHFRRYRGRRVPFSCFARPSSISAEPRSSDSVLHVLRSRTRFRRCRVRLVPFSCFAHPNSFSAVPKAFGPVFMFCAPGHVFGGTEGVWSHFHVLRVGTRFRRK